MAKVGQILQLKVKSVNESGVGIVKIQKDVYYIPQVLVNEVVKAKVAKRIKEGFVCEVISYIEKHKDRIKPICDIYQKCGSCHMLHIKEEAQLLNKQKELIHLVQKSGLSLKVHPVMGMEDPYAYRNKIIVGFTKGKDKKIKVGFYEEHSHCIVPYERCYLHDEKCDRIIHTIKELMMKFSIEPYDEKRKTGILRHVLLRKGTISQQIMVVLVINTSMFGARKQFVKALIEKHPEITTVVQNINPRKTSVVLGDQERILYGSGYIEDTLCGLKFQISAKSFYQINHKQTEVLYQKAIGLLKLKGNEVVIDAYCGIGTIGMYVSQFVKKVIGVEVNRDAVEDAKRNAKHNHISNIRFLCDDASRFMMKLASQKERVDVVIMDPPRSGSTEIFMNAIRKLAPKQVVYISCNPETQVRDLKYFKKIGYKASDMYPVDLFPHTYHVECVTLLVKA